jgi:hypothetical protein
MQDNAVKSVRLPRFRGTERRRRPHVSRRGPQAQAPRRGGGPYSTLVL